MSHRTTGIAPALSAAIEHEIGRLAEAVDSVRMGDAAALRHARVASRRLREMLAVVERAGADVPARRARKHLREITRALGPLRELEVARAGLDAAARRHEWPDDRVNPLRRWIDKEGKRRRARVETFVKEFDDHRLTRALRQTSDGLGEGIADRVWPTSIAARVLRRARAVELAAAACGVLYAPGRLHALRISIKKLRYALELSRRATGLEVAGPLRVLKRAQKHYGELHDLQVLLKLVTAAAAVGRSSALRVNAQIVTDALERDCRDLHASALRDSAGLDAQLAAVRRSLADAAAARKKPAAAGRSSSDPARLSARTVRPAAAAG